MQPRRDGKPGTTSIATIQKLRTALQVVCEQAVEWRLLATNPVGRLRAHSEHGVVHA
ncbi:MAG: hypothetical protein M0Z53_10680 [Thermaerobacter sp.]|nr:hypothetical protein [Thermaerobacter sp.]